MMEESNKLWVISLGDDCAIDERLVEQPEITRKPAQPILNIKCADPRPVIRKASKPAGRLHFATKLGLSYLMGPFALLLWAEAREKPFWAVMSLFSGIGSIVLAWKWRTILAQSTDGGLLIPLLTLGGILSFLAFTSWAKALAVAFTSCTRSHTTWPGWMRSSWGVTILGSLTPGLGLYLVGSYKRAVATVWAFWPVFLAVVFLVHSKWTWQWLKTSLHTDGSEVMFETMMMVAAGILILGLAGWLVQALGGLHLRTQSYRASNGFRGDHYAAALLVAVVALAVLFPSAELASFVNETGTRLHQEGFQQIPLQLARSARALDPGEMTYSMQVASLHRELGQTEKADILEQDLGQDVELYLGMMGRQVVEQKPTSAKGLMEKAETRPDDEIESWEQSLLFENRLDGVEPVVMQ